jgi:hypothetical protein
MAGSLDRAELKRLKEAFVSNLEGTTKWEIFCIIGCLPLCLLFGEPQRSSPQAPAAAARMQRHAARTAQAEQPSRCFHMLCILTVACGSAAPAAAAAEHWLQQRLKALGCSNTTIRAVSFLVEFCVLVVPQVAMSMSDTPGGLRSAPAGRVHVRHAR